MAKNSRRKKPQEDESAATAAAAERERGRDGKGNSEACARERRGQVFGRLSCLCALSVCGVKFRFISGEHFPFVFKYFRVFFLLGCSLILFVFVCWTSICLTSYNYVEGEALGWGHSQNKALR
jgi:hypothetical protein